MQPFMCQKAFLAVRGRHTPLWQPHVIFRARWIVLFCTLMYANVSMAVESVHLCRWRITFAATACRPRYVRVAASKPPGPTCTPWLPSRIPAIFPREVGGTYRRWSIGEPHAASRSASGRNQSSSPQRTASRSTPGPGKNASQISGQGVLVLHFVVVASHH